MKKMMTSFPYVFVFILLLAGKTCAQSLRDTEDCQQVGDNCPVWNGWTTPKCHTDDEPTECRILPTTPPQWICYKWSCTYCAAKAFGCSTDLKGGVSGQVVSFQAHDSFNCGNPEITGPGAFKIHCACGGACSFHANYKIYYTTNWPPKQHLLE